MWLLYLSLALVSTSAFHQPQTFTATQRTKHFNWIRPIKSIYLQDNSNNEELDEVRSSLSSICSERPLNRKDVLRALSIIPFALTAQSSSASATDGPTILDESARRFRRVPTFAIVDGSTGVPFMILQNSGIATGYFFTSYEGAALVLNDAKRDAAEKDLDTQKMWAEARISAVPLEFALKLSKAKPKGKAQNGVNYSTVYDIIPTINDLNDAGRIDKSGFFNQQGRVPLFYFDGMEMATETDDGKKKIPVYFSKSDLTKAWQDKFSDKPPPPVQVGDLIDTFSAMVNPGLGLKVDGQLLNNLVLIPTKEGRKAAVECEKSRGSVSAYKVGEMIAVGGK